MIRALLVHATFSASVPAIDLARLHEYRPPYGPTRSPRAHLGLHSHSISPPRLPGQVVAAGAAGGVPGWPKSLSGASSERVFRLAGGPSICWGRLGWPSSGSFCAGMAPDAGSEPLAGPPASAVSLRARSRAADIARSLCPDFGHLDASRVDESIFEKTPLCQPPETPQETH